MSDRMDMFIFNTSFYIYQTTKTPLCLNDTIVVVLVWYLDLQLSMQSVPITTNIVSSNPAQAMYVIQFVSHLRQVGGFLLVLRFPPSIKMLLKVALNTITPFFKIKNTTICIACSTTGKFI
jgi:hypothetical protein